MLAYFRTDPFLIGLPLLIERTWPVDDLLDPLTTTPWYLLGRSAAFFRRPEMAGLPLLFEVGRPLPRDFLLGYWLLKLQDSLSNLSNSAARGGLLIEATKSDLDCREYFSLSNYLACSIFYLLRLFLELSVNPVWDGVVWVWSSLDYAWSSSVILSNLLLP